MADAYEISDSESDQDLQEAIRLSLMESSGSPPPASATASITKRKADVIDLISDDEGDDNDPADLDGTGPTRKVPKASKDSSVRARLDGTSGVVAYRSTPGGATGLSALIGGRAQMERERLERLAKLKRMREGLEAAPDRLGFKPGIAQSYSHASGSTSGSLSLSGSARFPPVQTQRRQINTIHSNSTGSDGSDIKVQKGALYPDGIVRKTWVQGIPKTGRDITFEEVIQEETIYMAVLSAFQWHYDWVLQKLPLKKMEKFVMVMHAKEQGDREYKISAFGDLPRTTLVLPPMDGQVSCMHSKLMLLFHRRGGERWLRVVIPSANLTDYDWGERGGIMENMVFLIDLPWLKSPKPDQTLFARELHHFCSAKGIPGDILNLIHEYDFTKTKHMAFVHSIGGSNTGDGWTRTGYCGLGAAVKSLGYASGPGLQVDYVTSSLGAANADFVSNMYRAAMGDNGLRELQRRTNKPRKNAKKKPAAPTDDQVTDDDSAVEYDEETNLERIMKNLRVYFPSRDTVAGSKRGVNSGGTICFQPQWWNAPTFPKSVIRDCQSVRDGLLMHNKLLFARPSKQLQTSFGKIDGWVYVGSANFSESAWGKLVMDRVTKSPKVNCKNWECGVILPVPASGQGHSLGGGLPQQAPPGRREAPPDMSIFEKVVPVPMKVPAEPMEGKQPWFFGELQ